MQLLVFEQRSPIAEAGGAAITLELAVAAVLPHVCRQVLFVHKLCWAQLTLEGFELQGAMRVLVLVQGLETGEGGAACVTDIHSVFAVSLDMLHQLRSHGERLAADVAGEWRVAIVVHHVLRQVLRSSEGGGTKLTLVHFDTQVGTGVVG